MKRAICIRWLIGLFCLALFLTCCGMTAKAEQTTEIVQKEEVTFRDGSSYYCLAEGVVDLTEADWSYENGVLLLPAEQAEGISEDTLVFSREPIQGDIAMGYRVTGLEQGGDTVALLLEETEGTNIFSDYHAEMKHQPLKIASVRALNSNGQGDGTLLQTNILGDDNEKRTIEVELIVNQDISIVGKVTLGMYIDAEYDGSGLPTGYGILTKEVHVVANVKYKDSLINGSLAKVIMSAFRGVNEESRSIKLEVTLAEAGLFRIKGFVKFDVKFALVGTCDITFTKKTGVYLDGFSYRTVDEPMSYTTVKDFDISGSLSASFDMGISLGVTGFKDILSITGGVTTKIETKKLPQFDENIVCYDIPITYDVNMGMKFELGIGTEHLGYSFVEKTVKFFEVKGFLYSFHIEVEKDEESELYSHLHFLLDCSIPDSEKLTYKFITGTREKIEEDYTVYGQNIEDPGEPQQPNNRIRFLYWALDREGTRPYDFETPLTTEYLDGFVNSGTVKLYAYWSEPYRKVTVDFQAEGYDSVIDWQLAGTRMDQPTIPLRMDYHFRGFKYAYKNPNGGAETGDWDFAINTIPEADITITGEWEYEEGYNPVTETIQNIQDELDSSEERMNHYLDGIYFTKTMSTAVQALLHPVTDEALSTLGIGVVHITGYTGNEPVFIVPPTLDGRPVVCVDGSGFANKESLVGLVLPPTVLYISGFQDCPNLQFVCFQGGEMVFDNHVYHGIRRIASYTFYNCPHLEIVDIPGVLTRVDDYAFAETGLVSYDLPASVTTWGKRVFSSCKKLVHVSIPMHFAGDRHFMEEGFFENCEALETIDGLDEIYGFGGKALYNTGFKSLKLHDIAATGPDVISGCKNLKSFILYLSGGFSDFLGVPNFKDLPELETLEVYGNSGIADIHDLPKLKYLHLSSLPDAAPGEGAVYNQMNVYNLPLLEDAILEIDVKYWMSVHNCPNLYYLYTQKLLDGSDGFDDTYKIAYCPKLKKWVFGGTDSNNTHVIFWDVGLEKIDLRQFLNLTDVQILYNDNLTEVVFPEGFDMNALDMRYNKLLRDLNWLTDSIFVIPSYWDDLEKLTKHRVTTNPKLRRLVFEGNQELPQNEYYGGTFVIVCQPDSHAAEHFSNSYYSGFDPYEVFAPDNPNVEKRVVVFETRTYSTCVDLSMEGCSENSTRDRIVSYQEPGEKLKYPDLLFTQSGWALEGWYFDTDRTERVPDNMTVTDDVILYAKFVQQGSDFDWEISGDGIIITGYKGNSERISVPTFISGRPVKAIGDKAFAHSTARSISLPASIESIYITAFDRMDQLEDIQIESERYISADGILYYKDINGTPKELVCFPSAKAGSVCIPEGVETINADCIKDLTCLEEISFPESLERIESGAFYNCRMLKKVSFASDVSVGEDTFVSWEPVEFSGPIEAPLLCAWADRRGLSYNEYPISFDTYVTDAPETLRAGKSMEDWQPDPVAGQLFVGWTADAEAEEPVLIAEMPEEGISLHAVWKYLFTGENEVLTRIDPDAAPDVVISGEWTAIASGAITCDLDSIYIPAVITQIDDGAFGGTVGVIIGHAGSAAETYALSHGIPFEERTYTLAFATEWRADPEPITGPLGQAIELPVPEREGMTFTGWYEDGDRTIRFEADTMPARSILLFAGWKQMPDYEMEFVCRFDANDTVTIMGYTGDNPSPVFPATVEGLPVTAIAPYAFSGNTSIVELTIPACVETIGAYAFSNSNLGRIIIEGEDCEIGEGCFAGCACLIQVTLPQELVLIPANTFRGCQSLEEIMLPATVSMIEANAFSGCGNLETLTLPAGMAVFSSACFGDSQPKTVSVSDDNTYLSGDGTIVLTANGSTLLYACRNITSIDIPAGVTEIADRAFSGCRQLKQVTLPSGLVRIGNYAFSGCSGLTEIVIPSTVTEVGDDPFGDNTSIAIYVNSLTDPAATVLKDKYTVIAAAQPVPVIGIELSVSDSLVLGETTEAIVTLLPADATDRRTELYTDHPEIIEVSSDGTIRALAPGRAGIFARSANGMTAVRMIDVILNGTKALTLKVNNALYISKDGTVGVKNNQDYRISADELTGLTISSLSITTEDTSAELITSSYDRTFRIRVSTYTFKKELDLNAEFTLSDGTVASGSIHLCVIEERDTTLPQTMTLYEGDQWTYTGYMPTVENEESSLVSINPSIVRADGDTIYALKPGKATVRLPYEKGEMMVTVKKKGCDLTVQLDEGVVFSGYTSQLNTVCSDPECVLSYSSSEEDCVSVDDTGALTGHLRGPSEITVSAIKNGIELNRRKVTIWCVQAFTDLHIDEVFRTKTNYDTGEEWHSITAGGSLDVTGVARNRYYNYTADIRSIKVTSSDPSIISIDEDGTVHANTIGTATITVNYLATGNSESMEVTSDIWEAYCESLSTMTIKVGETRKIEFIKEKWDDAFTITYTPDDGDEAYLEVNEDGLVTGLNPTGYSTCRVSVGIYNQAGYRAAGTTVSIKVTDSAYAEEINDFPENISIPRGETATIFTAENLYPEGCGIDLYKVTSMDQTIVTINRGYYGGVDNSLTIQAVGFGETDICVQLYNGNMYMCHVTVTQPLLWAEIGNIPDLMTTGDKITLTAVNVTCQHDYSLTWSSSGNALSISSSGQVTANNTGSGRVTLTIKDNVTGATRANTYTIKVGPLLSGFKQLTNPVFTRSSSGYGYAWYVLLEKSNASDNNQTLVDRTSVIGTETNMYVRYDTFGGEWSEDKLYLYCSTTLKRPETISLRTDNGSLHAAKTQQFTVQMDSSNSSISLSVPNLFVGQKIDLYDCASWQGLAMVTTWQTADASIATVNSSGILEAKGVGATTVSGSYYSPSQKKTITGSAQVRVSNDQLTSITVDKDTITVPEGSYEQISISVQPYGVAFATELADNAIATISGTDYCTVTGKKSGSTTLRIYGPDGGTEKIIPITVKKALKAIEWNLGDAVSINAGDQFAVRMVCSPAEAGELISLQIADTTIATVSDEGTITGLKQGDTYIELLYNERSRKKAVIHVQQNAEEMTIQPEAMTIRKNEIAGLKFFDKDGIELDPASVLLSSSNRNIVSISPNGIVAGRGEGEATITARGRDRALIGRIRITVSGTLKMFHVPFSILILEEEAFAGNTGFEAVRMNASQIDARAFANCLNLKCAIIENGNMQADPTAFENCAEGFFVCCPAGSSIWQQAEENGWNPLPLDNSVIPLND